MGLFDKFKKSKPENDYTPDFSGIDSMEKVQQAVQRGELVPVYLMAPRFGGAEDVSNAVYAPPVIAQLKESNDDMIEGLLVDGKVNSYSARPQYKGDSFVPSSITIAARGEATFEETIEIW